MSFSAIFVNRPVATSLLMLGIALAGIVSFNLLPVAALPQVDFPVISVSASLPGASPETMATAVATPLERSLCRIAGVNEMTSSSTLGSTNITLQFDLERNINGAARDVQAAINAARTLLPTNLPTNPTYRKVNPADASILILALTSDSLSQGQLYDAASTIMAQKLSQIKGVGQVSVGGSSLPAVRVELNPSALYKYGIGLATVSNAISSTNGNRPKGVIESGDRQWQIYANDQVRRAKDYLPIIITYHNGAVVRLSDVAEVVDSVQDLRNEGISNGKQAVLIQIRRQPGANIIDTVDHIRAELPQLRASISGAIDTTVVSDRTPTIRASVHDVELTLVISIGLVIMVVFLFLRNPRATLIPAVAVPISLLGTFGVMYLCGYSLDNLSLMALTVATGCVVDDAIVVLENISRHIERGKTPLQAALAGSREIGFTVVSISLSLIAVFIPVLLMGGVVGRLFREFAVVLSVAILVSMVVSLSTTPMMCSVLLKPHAPVARPGRWARLGLRVRRGSQRAYRRTLALAMRWQPITLLLLAGVVGLNVYLYREVPKGFFPQQDTGRIVGNIRADQATSFQAMQRRLDRFMGIVRSDPAVEAVSGFTGGGQRNTASMFISLKPLAERGVSADQVVARLRAKLVKEPGATLFMVPVQDIRIGARGSNSQYEYTLLADTLEDLRAWEPPIRRAIMQLPELVDVNSDMQEKGLQNSLVIDRDAASRLGLSMSAIDTTLNDAFGQRQVGVIYNPLNQYRVVMELAPEYQQSPESLLQLRFTSSSGAQVPLSAFARVELTNTPLSVTHEAGAPDTTISFALAPGVSLSQATEAVNNAVAALGVPVSVRGSFGGTAGAFQKSMASQPLLILAALITIYLVLGILYEDLIHPVTILSTLPSAGVGALLALMLTDTEFSIIALIGVILLIGIVKKNAIMMIDFAITRQRQAAEAGAHVSAAQAIYRACQLRVRPILMTTVAAIFGAVPLALGAGDGAELRRPLGIAIVGGLLFSQLLTLYTTPVVFVCMDRLRQRLARRRATATAATAAARALPRPALSVESAAP